MSTVPKNIINENKNLYFPITENTISNSNILKEEKIINDLPKWSLEIPKINLKANIEEGTSEAVLNRNIGHFEETGIVDKNICLAAHNRGYEKNYFEKIHMLEEGDLIKYFYKNIVNTYRVEDNFIIEETNIKVLENADKEEITLITCVPNKPTLRRCIKAIKIEE